MSPKNDGIFLLKNAQRARFFRSLALAVFVLVAAGCQTTRSQPEPGQERPSTAPATGSMATAMLFNGRNLDGWAICKKFAFERHGKVEARDGALVLETGSPMTGVYWKGPFPSENYEVSLEAARLDGSDFFCGMTFPVGDSFCTLILGGWGGMVVGLSNVDHMSAAENTTTYGMRFTTDQWYRIRLRVSPEHIEAWIDDERVIRQERGKHAFDIWMEQEPAKPFGINTWETTGAIRNLTLSSF